MVPDSCCVPPPLQKVFRPGRVRPVAHSTIKHGKALIGMLEPRAEQLFNIPGSEHVLAAL
jgi:hypothetical protein